MSRGSGGARGLASRTSPAALEFPGGTRGERHPSLCAYVLFSLETAAPKTSSTLIHPEEKKKPQVGCGEEPSPPSAAPGQMCLLFTPLPGFWVTNSVTPRSQPSPEGMFEFVLSAGSVPGAPLTGGGRGSWKLELLQQQ